MCPHNTPKADVLDWEDENLPESVGSLGDIDVILCVRVPKCLQFINNLHDRMSDVTYNTSSFPALLRIVSKLMQMGEKPPAILLGYKERDIAERDLWTMMEAMGLQLEKVGERRGAVEPAVEIWFGQLIRPGK